METITLSGDLTTDIPDIFNVRWLMTRRSLQMSELRDFTYEMTIQSERDFHAGNILFDRIPKTVEVLFVAVLTSDVLWFLLLFGFLNTSSPLSSFLFVSAEKPRFLSLNFPLSVRLFSESLRLERKDFPSKHTELNGLWHNYMSGSGDCGFSSWTLFERFS